MMVGGIVLAGLGGATALTGVLYMAMANVSCSEDAYYTSGSCSDTKDTFKTIGLVMTIGGVAMVAGGIPLILIGAKRVPNTGDEAALHPSPPSGLFVGPSGLSLRGTF